ncbi:MAG: divergent PAP2 family protein [archaeon]
MINEIQILLMIALAFVVTQTSKLIINYRKTGLWQFSSYLQNGGMPSSHTSTSIAMTTGLWLFDGLTYYFIIAALFSIIVMNDAMKVRRETGDEARILNKVMEKENLVMHHLTERVGHTPVQVAVGFAVGVVCALIVYAL